MYDQLQNGKGALSWKTRPNLESWVMVKQVGVADILGGAWQLAPIQHFHHNLSPKSNQNNKTNTNSVIPYTSPKPGFLKNSV